MAKHVNITIDGRSFLVDEGKNLVTVAQENGIFIPSLCHFDHIDPRLEHAVPARAKSMANSARPVPRKRPRVSPWK
jgi:hypothetical protein